MSRKSIVGDLATPLAVMAGAGLLVALVAWGSGSESATRLALAGGATGLGLLAAAEGVARLAGVHRPLERLLLTMLVRSGGALAAVVAAVVSGEEPRVVALVAAPLYLVLVACEAYAACREAAAGAPPRVPTTG